MKILLNPENDWRHITTDVVAVNARRKTYHFFGGIEKDIWLALVDEKCQEKIITMIADKHRISQFLAQQRCEEFYRGLETDGLIRATDND